TNPVGDSAFTNIAELFVLTGDANHDGVVDTLDFNALATNFGGTGKSYSQGDFNYDGAVDTVDFSLLASNFGKTLPAPTTAMELTATPISTENTDFSWLPISGANSYRI